MSSKNKLPGRKKAREILRHGSVHGKPLTEAQRALFGILAGGGKPKQKDKYRGKTTKR